MTVHPTFDRLHAVSLDQLDGYLTKLTVAINALSKHVDTYPEDAEVTREFHAQIGRLTTFRRALELQLVARSLRDTLQAIRPAEKPYYTA